MERVAGRWPPRLLGHLVLPTHFQSRQDGGPAGRAAQGQEHVCYGRGASLGLRLNGVLACAGVITLVL